MDLPGAPEAPVPRIGLGATRVDPDALTERMISGETSPCAPATLSAS